MNNSRMALKTTGTTLKPSVAYNPGSLDEENLESLKMGVAEELWDISNNFVQTNEILGDTFEKIDTLEIDRDKANVKIEEVYRLSVEGDKALAEKITELSADMKSGDKLLSSQITETNRVLSELDKTTAENKLELESSISSVSNSAKSELEKAQAALDKAIRDGDEDEANRLRAEIERLTGIINANKADIEAKLNVTNTTIAELDKAMAENKLEMEASIKGVGDSANSSNSAAVDKAEKELEAARKALADAIASGDDDAAKKLKAEIDRLMGIINSNKTEIEAKLAITNTTIAELDKALAENKTELESKITSSSGQAVTDATTQAKKDLSEAQKALNKAIADGDSAEAAKLAAEVARLTGVINSNKSDIEAKLSVTNTTIATLDKAVSSQITNVQADYNGKFGSVNQTLSATVDKLGKVESKWGIEMDANGKISGVSMNNNGTRSDFEVRADKFAFTDTSGGKSGGFSSSGGVTTFNGIINAQAGVFNGTVNAVNGVFNGTVNANGGNFNNVIIRENCTVLGDLNAGNIVGGLSDIVSLSTNPNQDYNFGVSKRTRSVVVSRFDVVLTSPTVNNGSISAWCQITINGNVRTIEGRVTSTPQGGTRSFVMSCGHVVPVPAGQTATVSIRIWNDNPHGGMDIDSIGAFTMAI